MRQGAGRSALVSRPVRGMGGRLVVSVLAQACLVLVCLCTLVPGQGCGPESFAEWEDDRLTVLLTSLPLRGHVTPMLYVANELAHRGANVVLAFPPKATPWIASAVLNPSIVHCVIDPDPTGLRAAGLAAAKEAKRRTALIWVWERIEERILLPDSYQAPYEPLRGLYDDLEGAGHLPDVAFTDFISYFGMDAADTFKVPVVVSTPSVGAYQHNAMLVPSMNSGFSVNMSVMERVVSSAMSLIRPILHIPMAMQVNNRRKSLGLKPLESVTSYTDQRLQICFTTIGLEYPQWEPPLIRHVGPAQVSQSLPLFSSTVPNIQSDVATWLEMRAAEGQDVIYVSAGSTKLLSPGLVRLLYGGLAEFVSSMQEQRDTSENKVDIAVLWNLDAALIPELPKELPAWLLVKPEVAQPHILSHRAVTLFLTHCGLNSVNEAILAGVPMLGMPFKFDQQDNAVRMEDAGLGRSLAKLALSSSRVRDALMYMMEHLQEYQTNVLHMRDVAMREGGSSEAAKLIEDVAATGIDHLLLPATLQYPLWHMMMPCIVLLLLAWTLYRMLQAVYRRLHSASRPEQPPPAKRRKRD